MKHLKLFFALFAMLALGVGNAWGAEVTETITMKNFGGLTTSSLIYQTKPGLSDKGTGMVAFAFTPTTGQVRGNQTGIVGASVTTDQKSHNWSLYNSDPMAGVIKAIKVTQTATGTNKFQNNLYVSLGTSSQGEVNAVTNAQKQDAGGTAQEINFTIDPSKGYTYFKLLSNEKFTSGTVAGVIVTVTYETAGGGETPDPDPTPDPTTYTIKWHTAKGVTTDVTLNKGATITKPTTDPTMTGYAFRGWTEDCAVASDGSGFTAISNFGTATEDKDYYAVFAVETNTSGEGSSNYEKVTSNLTDWAGDYLIAYNNTTFADGRIGGTSGMGAQNTKVDLSSSISNNTIPASVGDQYNVTLEAVSGGYVLKTKDEQYNYQTSNKNGLTTTTNISTATTYAIKVTFASENDIKLALSGGAAGAVFRYNTDGYFRFYKDGGQSAVYLYKKVAGGSTTTYSNYITTCASDIEYIELGDDFKWSAAEAEVTIDATDNVFPSLTNTHNVPVTYSSSDDAIATIAADGTVTLKKEGTVTITAKYAGGTSAGTGKEYKAKTVDYTLTVKPAPLEPIAGGVIDILDNAWTELTNSDYKTVDAKTAANTGHSNAQYTAQCAGSNSSIQLRSNNSNSGIVSTVSGGLVKRVEIEWNDATSADRTLNIYGSNTPYTNPTDLYDTNKDGDKLGTIVKGTSTHLEISEDYRYIGLRSASGAMYLTKVTITWLPINSKVSIDDAIQHGSISVSGATDLNAVAAGTELTLDNNPTTGYKLAAYDVYKTDDATTKVTVTDGKFIMPEFDVTISATFELTKTLTSIEITTPATQTTFWQGEAFNHDGLKVTAHFDGADDEDVTDKVTVTGSTATAGAAVKVTVSFTEGTTTKTATYTITVKATANTTETAYDVATAREIIDKVSTANDIYVQGIVSKIVTAYNSTYGNITYDISADGLTTSLQLQAYRGKSFNGDNFTSADDVKVGDEVVVFGNLLKYNSTYELAENNKLISLNRNKAVAGLAYETKEYTAKVNEAFSTPVLTNPNNLTVTYSSSDENLATVDATTGAVTILDKTGKVTITATFDGNAAYLPGTASYNITITDPNQLEATFVAADDKGNTTQGEGEIIKSPITFACSDGILGNGEEYRIYANAKAIFSAAEGYIITKVVLTSTASDDSKYGPAKLSTEDSTYTYSGKEGTWVGEAYTVTLTASAQTRATKITVYYKQDNRVDAGLAWNPATVSLTVDDAFTAPTFSNPNTLAGITFTSDNEALATVDDAGAISLVSGKTGTATITATFAGDENYKAAKVTCTIIVNHKSEDVVILAKCKDQYYALVAENLKSDVLKALPVEYVNGKIYNVETEDQASIIWKRVVVDGKTTFKNGDNYLSAVNSAALNLATEACEWVFEGDMYKIEGSTRTILYYTSTGGFKNYSTTNMSNDGVNGEYSSAAITVDPIFADGDAYHRTTTPNKFGTICLPFGSANYSGATFYEFVGSETGKVYLGSVTTLEAGVPYIFEASATEVAVYGDGTTAATAGNSNGLYGTFDNNTVVTADGNNYILLNNELCLCSAECYVNANRAYIKMDKVPVGKPNKVAGRRYIGMSVQGENEATGFENITAPEGQVIKAIVNGQLVIIRGGEMYNVQGQKL